MQIPASVLKELTRQVNLASSDATERIRRVLVSVDWSGDLTANSALLTEAVQMILGDRTQVAAQAAADFYDVARQAALGEAFGAKALSGYDPRNSKDAVGAAIQLLIDGKPPEAVEERILKHVDATVRRSANQSVVGNGYRDTVRPKYARIPTGAETCDFCRMLASRGFDFSYDDSDFAKHSHAGCDCRVVPQWDDRLEYEGYDPSA